jgi:hypothetical protein
MDRDYDREGCGRWLCPGCNRPRPDYKGPIDVHIQGTRAPSGGPFSFVFDYGISFARRDFLQSLLGQSLEQYLILGRVFTESRELVEWATLRGINTAIIRGKRDVAYRICDVCHSQAYFANGTRYLYPAPPPEIPVFESHLHGLLVRETAGSGKAIALQGKLVREAIPVLSKPLDGLEVLRPFEVLAIHP